MGGGKPEDTGPILLVPVKSLVVGMMISHMMYLVEFKRCAVAEETEEAQYLVQEGLMENGKMRMIVFNEMGLPHEHNDEEHGIPGPSHGKCSNLNANSS